jgi:hypothetical protein
MNFSLVSHAAIANTLYSLRNEIGHNFIQFIYRLHMKSVFNMLNTN